MTESIKYPITLVFGTLGSIWGMKHLVKLRSSKTPFDIFKQTMKYIGTTTLFTIPTMLINSYFANAKKMSARICDMLTIKDLEDYRFFADYSKFKDE